MELREFQAGLKAFARKIQPAVIDLQARVFERIATDVTEGTPDETPPTPYKTGYARANWMPSIGTPSGALMPEFHAASYSSGAHKLGHLYSPGFEGLTADEAALTSLERLPGFLAELRGLKGYKTAYLTNNVPYIMDLEHGSSRRQAPHGFAHLAVKAVAGGVVKLRKTDITGAKLGPAL